MLLIKRNTFKKHSLIIPSMLGTSKQMFVAGQIMWFRCPSVICFGLFRDNVLFYSAASENLGKGREHYYILNTVPETDLHTLCRQNKTQITTYLSRALSHSSLWHLFSTKTMNTTETLRIKNENFRAAWMI